MQGFACLPCEVYMGSVCLMQDFALLTMPQPEGNLQPGVEENIPGIIAANNTITRHGGMMHPAKRDRRRIVVDVREFMSPLPCVLHQQSMDVVPVTLEVCLLYTALWYGEHVMVQGRAWGSEGEACCKTFMHQDVSASCSVRRVNCTWHRLARIFSQ